MAHSEGDAESGIRMPPDRLQDYVEAIFSAAGSDAEEARTVAAHLVEASLAGHDSHGVMRVTKYIDWVKSGQVLCNRHADTVIDRGAMALVDGNFGFGQVIGREAMTIAAAKAAEHGFAVVSIRNAGHLGRIGAWAEQLAEAGLASFHFVNTSGFGILVAPHGGSDRRLSANPLAAGVPVAGAQPLILDMATSVIAEGKIQVARNQGARLAPGQVIDGAGRPTTDPEAFYADPPGAIFPFGGHKGMGLSFFCEVLAGSLSGGFASNPGSPTAGRLVNNMLSMAFDPAAFGGADAFAEDIRRLVAWTKGSPPIEPGGVVLLPGEIEDRTRNERRRDGIPIDHTTFSRIVAAGESVGVPAPQ
ncbi:MAG: malate/lactate/ureidoglycolate dehydrogenase [Hyphomicrobiales bacterium]|nr:malate/lactate/ureidoglycolate dehydrogenase [Hyphomicrobiales bacterium]